MPKPVTKAVFPVGGLGTRFLPATKAMPKEMLPVVDKPLVQYVVDEAVKAGIDELIFVTGKGKTAIEDYLDQAPELEAMLEGRGKEDLLEALRASTPPGITVTYTRQPQPLGLGHAVWCARKLVGDEPFAVLLADDLIKSDTPCLKQMIEAYNEVGGNILAVMEVPMADTGRYGVVSPLEKAGEDSGAAPGHLFRIKQIVEKPDPAEAPSNLAVVGRYILQPEVFGFLEGQRSGAGGEIQLTDAIATLMGRQELRGLRFAGTRYDCGSKLGYMQANLVFGLEHPDTGAGMREFIKTLDL